jgi:hypothetical protein
MLDISHLILVNKMRTFSNIIILVLIFSTTYVYRFEIKGHLNSVFSRSNVLQFDTLPVSNFEINPEDQTKIDVLKKIIAEPKPLRIIDPIITGTINYKTLSVKGIVDHTNSQRKLNNNLPELKINEKLNQSAMKKVEDMFKRQYFEHDSPDGRGVGDLVDDASYDYIVVGENLALGNFEDDKKLVQAWMDSPGHRANILSGKYSEIGVAVGQGFFNDRKLWLAVQHFGAPKSLCPIISMTLETEINFNTKKVEEYKVQLAAQKNSIESGGLVEGKTITEQIIDHNILIDKYNKLVMTIRGQIDEFNNQVNKFNSCVQNISKE